MFCTHTSTTSSPLAAGFLEKRFSPRIFQNAIWPHGIKRSFTRSVEVKQSGKLSNMSEIVAHDCINGSAYPREMVQRSLSCFLKTDFDMTNENLRRRFRWSLCCMSDIDVMVLVLSSESVFCWCFGLQSLLQLFVECFTMLVAGSLRQQYHKPSTIFDGDRCASYDSLYTVLLFYAIQN